MPWLLWRMQGFWQWCEGKLGFGDRVWNSSSWWLLFFCCCCCYPCGATDLQGQKRGTRAFRTLRVLWRTFGGTFKVLFEWRTLSTCAAWSSGIRKCHNHQMHKSSVKTKDVKMWNPNLLSFNFQAEKLPFMKNMRHNHSCVSFLQRSNYTWC